MAGALAEPGAWDMAEVLQADETAGSEPGVLGELPVTPSPQSLWHEGTGGTSVAGGGGGERCGLEAVPGNAGDPCPLTPLSEDEGEEKGPWEKRGAWPEWAAGQLNLMGSEQGRQAAQVAPGWSLPDGAGHRPRLPGCLAAPFRRAWSQHTDTALGFLTDPTCGAVPGLSLCWLAVRS